MTAKLVHTVCMILALPFLIVTMAASVTMAVVASILSVWRKP